MIIWLASYPKSGNTWVRAFVSSLLFKKNDINSLDNMKQIHAYPLTKDFYNLLNDFNNLNNISECWGKSQSVLNLDKKIKFLKTHHISCKINGFNFTNQTNTLGTIYVVRDPRNVVSSIKNHWSKSIKESREFITDDYKWIGVDWNDKTPDLSFDKKPDSKFPTLIGSWKTHYNLWKQTKNNFLLVKYENMLNNPDEEFRRITNFISKFVNKKFDEDKIKKAIENNSFNKLKAQEQKDGFEEAIFDKNLKKTKNFFHLGPNNDWKKILDEETKSFI
jgi:hypothetical protein